jgi:hypothetical protein
MKDMKAMKVMKGVGTHPLTWLPGLAGLGL